ncbi:MAG: QueT transporter family protein [Tissierellia bacterium]|nr:QueT transporter family protein [Tissierellia bacterium]
MKNTKFLVQTAVIAGIYAVLTIAFPFSYGPIQFRFPEALTLLAYYNPAFIPGLTLGCGLANIASPFGIIDVIFGSLATFLSLFAMTKVKNIYLASIMPAIFNGVIISLVIVKITGTSVNGLLIGAQIFLSEIIIVSIIGIPLFRSLQKNSVIMEKIRNL